MPNLSKLLNGAAGDVSFLQKLDLQPAEVGILEAARKAVREALTQAFTEASVRRFGIAVTPRYYTQGSYAYGTLNRPAFPGPQQKDLDDGVYLPLTFGKDMRPSDAAEVYFSFVDEVLRDLCRVRGWTFSIRPTCARVYVAPDAHVDVPLYAIPDAQFALMAKSVTASRRLSEDAAIDFMNVRRIDRWDKLPSEEVLLAHREEDWKVSDPRKIHEWFLGAVDTYGEQLRRMSRYLKAWRDQQGEKMSDVSSICLMACAFEVYRTASSGLPARDDRALLQVAERLPKLLESVPNPTDPEEKLCKRLGAEERKVAISLAAGLAASVGRALEAIDPERSIEALQASLGDRIPNRPDLVSSDSQTVATVRSEPARIIAAPVVGRSISG